MEELDIPTYFLCPISLEIMRDPVTVSTGITYDRNSIEKWLFTYKKGNNNQKTCPATKQTLSDTNLTPNHTVRRLIQAWCVLNSSKGVERIPTPKPPISTSQLSKLVAQAAKFPGSRRSCLKTLRTLSNDSDMNSRRIELSGAIEFLASIVKLDVESRDEALSILYRLRLSEKGVKILLKESYCQDSFLDSLIDILRMGSIDARAYSMLLLASMTSLAEPSRLVGLRIELFVETAQLLRSRTPRSALNASLKMLTRVCPWGHNRVKAVEAGLVSVIVDILADCAEKKTHELALAVLEEACMCAEGRAEFVKNAAGLRAVGKNMLAVSEFARDRAVRVLVLVSRYLGIPCVVQEMADVGVAAKLCLVMQCECGERTKEKAKEILKRHAGAWRNSPFLPSTLISSPVV